MERILCAIDRSEPSLRAAKLAMNLAERCKAELLLLNVVPALDTTQRDLSEYLRREHEQEAPAVAVSEAAQDELRRFGDWMATQGNVATQCEIRFGEAASEIVSSAKDHAIDLIVVGHRGQNRLARLLLGSVARKVVDTAPCPVLVVH